MALPWKLPRLLRQGGEKMERATRSWILKDASAYAAATAKLLQRNLTAAQRLLARRQGGNRGGWWWAGEEFLLSEGQHAVGSLEHAKRDAP